MCSIVVKIPDEVLYDTKMSDSEAMKFASQMTALGLYTRRKVSIGYCAQIAGMSESEFVSFLGQNNISMFRFDSKEELLKDIENA